MQTPYRIEVSAIIDDVHRKIGHLSGTGSRVILGETEQSYPESELQSVLAAFESSQTDSIEYWYRFSRSKNTTG